MPSEQVKLVGFFPCDLGCVDVTPTSYLHLLISTIPAVCLPLAMVLSSKTIVQQKDAPFLSPLVFLGGVLSMSSGMLMFLPGSEAYVGLIQRIGFGLSLQWI